MFVTMREILGPASEGGYAVIAPNFSNELTARAAIEVAVEMNSPVILDGITNDLEQACREAAYVRYLAAQVNVPVALNEDHGPTYEAAINAVRAGYSSIMVDRSSLPYEENVAQVAELAKIAHQAGMSVEAELGHVGQGDNYEHDGVTALTVPEEAVRYVEETGVDCLAVAVGTAHGAYKGTPHIDFERLEAIRKVVPVPLVLHGGSGTGDENLYRAARSGIAKINIATDAFTAAYNAMEAAEPGFMGMGKFDAYLEGYKSVIRHYMELFGSVGKA